MDELRTLENDGWIALSTGADAVRAFYGDVLDDDVVMLLPDGLSITGRDEAIEAMSGAPWDNFALDHVQVRRPTPDTGLVTYAAKAKRGDVDYSALVSSLYVRRGDRWSLVHHQHTPS